MNDQKGRASGMGLEDITPSKFFCGTGGCPGVYRKENGNLIIVGSMVLDQETLEQLKGRVSEGETLIEVPAGLVLDLDRSSGR